MPQITPDTLQAWRRVLSEYGELSAGTLHRLLDLVDDLTAERDALRAALDRALGTMRLDDHYTPAFWSSLEVPPVPTPSRTLTITFDREADGRWIASVLEFPGAHVYGASRTDALTHALTLALAILAAEPGPRNGDIP